MDSIMMVVCAIVSFAVTVVLGIWMIPFLRKLKYGQTILEDGPVWHKSKQGTPVMGGLLFICGIVISFVCGLCFAFFSEDVGVRMEMISTMPQQHLVFVRVLAGLGLALGSGAIGFMDDYIKVVKKQNLGLTVKQKTLLQLLVAAAFLATLAICGDTTTMIPFVGEPVDGTKGIGLIYWPIALMFIYGFVNSVNLTDGVDGLCSGVTLMVSVFFIIISNIAGSSLGLLAVCAAGGCTGFLFWNLKPAKVFMGDTGSLFLGGLVCGMAFASEYPVVLLLAGIVYLLEALSDIIQVAYYKKTKKRIFKMAPIHHHFEMCGWSENKIVVVFSLVTVIGCVLAGLCIFFG